MITNISLIFMLKPYKVFKREINDNNLQLNVLSGNVFV